MHDTPTDKTTVFNLHFLILGCLVYLCDFHREQAWVRWVNKTTNEVTKEDKDVVLTSLRALAKAPNEELFQTSLADLQNNAIWKVNKKLQNWMNTTWLPEKKVSFKYSNEF